MMEFKLETFSGPLDLLLTLIAKNKVSILDIPIKTILEQYLEAIDTMQGFDAEETSAFISMAAKLVFIKSKLLLPRHEDEPSEDPREELARMLLEYSVFKKACMYFNNTKDIFTRENEVLSKEDIQLSLDINELGQVFFNTLKTINEQMPPRAELFEQITASEIMPVSLKTEYIIKQIIDNEKIHKDNLFGECQSKTELIATFLAILELLKASKIKLIGDFICS